MKQDERQAVAVVDGLVTLLSWSGFSSHIDVPEGIQAIGDDCFAGRGFRSVRLPAGLIRIGRRAFEKCARLEELTLPDSVVCVDVEAFNGCQGLKTLRLGSGLRTIQARAFWYCIGLRELELPASLELIASRAFEGCDRLERVAIRCANAEFDEYVFNETPYWHRLLRRADLAAPGMLGLTPECPEELLLPEGHTHIDLYAFARSRIRRARLPGSLRTMGMCAFRDCKQLEEVTLSVNTYCNYHLPLEPGEGIFAGCTALHTVRLKGRLKNFSWDGDDRPEVLKGFHPEKTFLGCTALHRLIAWQILPSQLPPQWQGWALNGYLEDEERSGHFLPEVCAAYDALLRGRQAWIVGRAAREGLRPLIQYLCEKRLLDEAGWQTVMDATAQRSDAPSVSLLLHYRHEALAGRDPLAGALDEL